MKLTVGKLTLLILVSVVTILDVVWMLRNGSPFTQNTFMAILVGVTFILVTIGIILVIFVFIHDNWDEEI